MTLSIQQSLTDLSGASFGESLLVTNRKLARAIDHIKDRFDILYLDETDGTLPKVTALLSSGWDRVDSTLLNRLPNLKVISHLANGLDAIDLKTTEQRKIALFNTPDAVVNDTADLALALMLNIARRIVFNHKYVEQKLWGNQPYPLGHTLTAKRVGIVGLGRIGKTIARRCLAFDMQIDYWGRQDQEIAGYTYHSELSSMAAEVDFLVVCCAGNEQTFGIINKTVLTQMKPSAYFINVARGFVVDERALISSLQQKRIAGAGLDVFANEPSISEEFFSMDNVVLQPHAGSATEETRGYMFWQVASHLVEFFERKK